MVYLTNEICTPFALASRYTENKSRYKNEQVRVLSDNL